jgi:hypothetical protein
MDLNEEKLEALRSWGERLEQTSGEESAAVGRAILMLVEEIDRLHIELWHARLPSDHHPGEDRPTSDPEAEPVPAALHLRLKRLLQRSSDAPTTSEAEDRPAGGKGEKEGEEAVQAWLASLRSQK